MTRAALTGRLDLDATTRDALVAHARSDAPYEVCGILAFAPADGTADGGHEGTDAARGFAGGRVVRHWRIRNAQRSMTYYEMDSRELLPAVRDLEDNGWGMAIYHSHTHTEAFPSRTDVAIAAYPEAAYVIVSLQDDDPVVRAFDIVDGRVTERVVRVDGEEAPVGPR